MSLNPLQGQIVASDGWKWLTDLPPRLWRPLQPVDWVIAGYLLVMLATQATAYYAGSTYVAYLVAILILPSIVPLRRYKLTPELWLQLLLLAIVILSGINAPDAFPSVGYYVKVMLAAIMIQLRCDSIPKLRVFLAAAFIGAMLVAVAGIALGGEAVDRNSNREVGVTVQANAYGTILVGGIYCSFLLSFVIRKWRVLLAISWVIFLVAMAGSGSRQALTNVTILLLCYALLEWVSNFFRSLRHAATGVVILSGFAALLLALRESPLLVRMASTSVGDETRIAVIQIAWSLFKENPWLGIGPGGFRLHTQWVYTHTTFMELLATTGVFSFVCYYGVLLVLGARLIRLRSIYRSNPPMRRFFSAMVSVLCATVTAGGFALTHVSKLYSFILAALIGISAELAYTAAQRHRKAVPAKAIGNAAGSLQPSVVTGFRAP